MYMLSKTEQIHELVTRLNHYRHEYYNQNRSSVSDAVYDRLYDELVHLEKKTGIIFSNSPTQTVGYKTVGSLPKVNHRIPLLSLDKTKSIYELISFLKGQAALLMLKLDGLTVKLVYENGMLLEGSTRGDGDVGEIITHNLPAFRNIPKTIPYKNRLVVTGEGFIQKSVFERLKNTLVGSNGESYKNARNLASGSIRCLDATVCLEREVNFYAFNVLEGLEEFPKLNDSRSKKLLSLTEYGFQICPFQEIKPDITTEVLELQIKEMTNLAERLDIPIDGMVLRFDSLSYSVSLGRTGHHYNDGLAYKFEDDTYETVFHSIEWNTSRNGEIAPVALFDTVEIDGCEVSRASLHNLSFIKNLELHPGCRILISKRNMIIPHVEENLDRGNYQDMIPKTCPCCGHETRIYSHKADNNRIVETLHCDNLECRHQILQQFVHFAEKKAMDIKGISKSTLEKFIQLGYLKSFPDIYHLDQYRDEIISLEGFGEKSYKRMWASIQESRNTTFVRYVVAMDIPGIGRTASKELNQYFEGNLSAFELAAMDYMDFTCLKDFGKIMSHNIHAWFHDSDHIMLWRTLQKELIFETQDIKNEEDNIMSDKKNNLFAGCTIVATGKLEHFTRDSINSKIVSLGAIAGSSVTKNTNYVICGEKAGSKLAKAQKLGVPVLSEQQFLDMISA